MLYTLYFVSRKCHYFTLYILNLKSQNNSNIDIVLTQMNTQIVFKVKNTCLCSYILPPTIISINQFPSGIFVANVMFFVVCLIMSDRNKYFCTAKDKKIIFENICKSHALHQAISISCTKRNSRKMIMAFLESLKPRRKKDFTCHPMDKKQIKMYIVGNQVCRPEQSEING